MNMPLRCVKVPHPATSDNSAGAKYFRSWKELNFSRRMELLPRCGVNVNARECASVRTRASKMAVERDGFPPVQLQGFGAGTPAFTSGDEFAHG
jgi:hypothetical protein